MIRKTRQIRLGDIKIGNDAPISIQSMTNTDTRDVAATVKQISVLEKSGCEIVRIAVRDADSAKALARIKSKARIPIEADIHFDYRLALLAIKSGVDGIRLNPGNIYNAIQVKRIITECKFKKIPVRIGVNSGSLPKCKNSKPIADNMVKAALKYIKLFEKERFYDIMISLKASDVATTIAAYRKMSLLCRYPLHLGVTATGEGTEALIKSAIGIGALLSEGIGDTIRVSLTGDPIEEVFIGKEILQALGKRYFKHDVISCPTCGRCQVDLIKMVREFKKKLARKNPHCMPDKKLQIAIMGCEVNGPGEAKESDIGIAFGKESGMLFKKGKVIRKIKVKDAVNELLKLVTSK
ncbi:MAG: flavodoxin-dependent (E)-4-hydroxy-3-methylbut-2-enyl-diphosphate synthase [Candidatus Orphnella occulta]|nr:flavodoxin-dependent (E)-4-hydroxy-3-methylbut-2-enyl-diphosphate synthase [Candidatus Orphnella occulta]